MKIVISGTVGVGKSTTAELLVKTLEEKGYKVNFLKEETVDSPYLSYYYDEPESWAFLAQLDFLLGRFKQWLKDEKERGDVKDDKVITIYDRHVLDDFVFAELHSVKQSIMQLDSIVYQSIYKEIIEKIKDADSQPDAFVLLHAQFDVISSRLQARGREEEKDTANDYWKELYDSYYVKPKFQHHFKKHAKKVIQLETDELKPEEVVERIVNELNL